MHRALITDYTFESLDLEKSLLEPLDFSVQAAQCRTVEDLLGPVQHAEFILTQFAPLTAAVIESMECARVIVRYGIGVDNVDLDAARKKGIPVCNVPDYCIDEVADHTLALLLAATRRVVENAQYVRDGNWGLNSPLSGMKCLRSLRVGIVGFGRIGREVAARLRSFKCSPLVFDSMVDDQTIQQHGCEAVSWEALLANSDVITLHCPANEQTHHLIGEDAIANMKKGGILVNVARGSVVSTEALLRGLREGKIAFAALDVLEQEPPTLDHPLRTMDNVVLHSHIASASAEAVHRLRTEVVSTVLRAARNEPLTNVVNGVVVNYVG